MRFLYETKEKEIQDFIFKAIQSSQSFYLSIDSDEFSFCIDCMITGVIDLSDKLEVYFTTSLEDTEKCFTLSKEMIKNVKILEFENSIMFDFEDLTVSLYSLNELD